MATAPLITLTTDFGDRDSYVAQMKGVIAEISPATRVVDLCHHVPPQAVDEAGFILETGYAAFPPGTIHVAVVDPGVGSARRAIAVRTGRHVFVAPDNGLLARVLGREPACETVVLQARRYRRESGATTFDGRDVLAPAAAWIAAGVALQELGPPAGALVGLGAPRGAPVPGQALSLAVLHVDRFGNVVLDVRDDELRAWLGRNAADGALRLRAGSTTVTRVRTAYCGAPPGEPFLLVGSSGYLEVAVDRGSAGDLLGLAPGARVELRSA